jgi:hypothetical protein
MAFQTGSQINPSLGAINYTPYMQGAVAGAQSIGQGIANLGQGIASGIEGYYKKKEEKAQLDQATGVVSNLIKTDPQLAGYIGLTPNEKGEFDQKAIAAGVKAVGAGPIIQLAQNLQAQSAAQQSENRIASAALALSGEGMGPVPVGNRAAMLLQKGYTPSQVIAAQNIYGKMEEQRAGIGKTIAETEAAKTPKLANLSFNEQAFNAEKAAREQKLGRPLNAEQTAQLFADIQGRNQPQVPGPAEMANIELMKKRNERMLEDEDLLIKSAIRLEPAADQLIKALDSGKVDTGLFGNAFSLAKRAGEAVGLPDLGATENEIAQKGLASLNAASLSGLARGLGSMSNADREFFTSGMPTITNRENTIRFYAEMAKANAAFAKEDRDFMRKQEKAGVPYQDILAELEIRRDNLNVGQSIYDRVIGSSPASEMPVAGQTTKVKF